MATSPQELEDLTFGHLPHEFLKRALASVFQAHRIGDTECRAGFADKEAENLLPYYRRAKLEGYLRDAADLVPSISASVVRADRSNWNHTEIAAGPIVLTASSVPTPCAMVERAGFRETLALSAQCRLWDEDPPDDARLYVLLLHSRSAWDNEADRKRFGHLPGSAHLAFPSPGLDHYVHEINLFRTYPDIVDRYIPKDWDQAAQVRFIRRAAKSANG